MEKKPKNRLEQVKEAVAKGEYTPKSAQNDKKSNNTGETKGKPNFIAILFLILFLGTFMSFWAYVTYGGSFFDENVTHRSCDFLSIEGLPTLVRCSDGTYWDASKHTDGQSGSVEEIVPVAMVVEITPPPFPYLMEDISKL